MRYYISDIDIINKLKIKKKESFNIKEIYSLSGIYQVINDYIYKLKITDKKVYNKEINNFKIIIDDTIINKIIVKNIPTNHVVLNKIVEKYEINNVILIVEKNSLDKSIISLYFEFNSQNKMIIKEISSLLLSIK